MPPLDQISVDETATMSFGDHLDELRSRLMKALILPLPLMFVTYFFSAEILDLICRPLRSALRAAGLNDRLQVLSPTEALMTQIKISVITALILAAPWILWQAWQFIRPGLHRKERRFVYFLIPGSAVMTAAGLAVYYFIMLPLVLYVLVGFGTVLDDELSLAALKQEQAAVEADIAAEIDAGTVAPTTPTTTPTLGQLLNVPILAFPPDKLEPGMCWLTRHHELIIVVPAVLGADPTTLPRDEAGNYAEGALELRRILLVKSTAISQEFRLSTYVSFVMLFALGMVIAFQTPLVMLLLGWMNLASVHWLRANRKYALFGTAVLGAVLTPADPGSMVAMWVPLYLLFEFGILLMALLPAKKIAGS
ncbi:MAG: twin-arginine translocase subunit TatC [Phycisphaerales bacterium]